MSVKAKKKRTRKKQVIKEFKHGDKVYLAEFAQYYGKPGDCEIKHKSGIITSIHYEVEGSNGDTATLINRDMFKTLKEF